ncbi:MAG TPA: G1 family glutamic endopeptidase [Chloroflexota bacterium]
MNLKSILSRTARVGAATMVVAGCLVGTATADGGGEMPNSHPMLLLNALGSQNWAGWASFGGTFLLPQSGAVSYVKGEWTIPALNCAGADADSSIWVGIDGMANNTVEQIGTEQDCVAGKAVYKAWWETYPAPKTAINLAIKPGDAVRGEVRYAGSSQFELTLTNLTTGQSFQTTQVASGAARSSAEWIVEAPYNNGVLPLANFGSVSFRNAGSTINGSTGPIVRDGGLLGVVTNLLKAQGFQMQGLLNPKASATNPASSAGNDAFKVTWLGR